MLVLDTCAWIWLVNCDPIRPDAVRAIEATGRAGAVIVPAISYWEVAALARMGRFRLAQSVDAWLGRAADLPGSRTEPLTAAMALDAANLPGPIHGDPADRFIIATGRAFDAPVVTRDTAILAYGRTGNVRVLRC